MRPAAIFSLVFLLFSCTKDVGYGTFGDYPDEVGSIIRSGCAVQGCHNNSSYEAAGGFNMSTWSQMFQGSRNGSPVIPFSSEFSSLCYFINTYPDLGPSAKPTMPLNRDPLSIAKVRLIKEWIDKGAPDKGGNIFGSSPLLKKAYVVNQGCGVVTVLDANTHAPIRFIKVGRKPNSAPHQVRVSPDGKYWYVVFINENFMQQFSCSDDRFVREIPLSPAAAGSGSADAYNWNTFVITKDGRRAYCASLEINGSMAAVDLEQGKLVHFLGGLHNPHGIALDHDQQNIYVGTQVGNFVSRIDTGFSSITHFPLDGNALNYQSSLDPHDMVLQPNSPNLFITCQKSNEVRVLNVNSGTVVAVVKTGNFPQEIVGPDIHNQYYVTCTSDSTTVGGAHGIVTRINGLTWTTSHLAAGYQPHGLAINGDRLYVVSRNISASGPLPHHTSVCGGRNGFLQMVRLSDFTLLNKRIELSVDPYFIFVRP